MRLSLLPAAVLALGCATPPAGRADPTPEELGITWVAETKEPSGFVVGGTNPTALIKTLMEINRRPVADLEKAMRPGADSTAGFLGPDEGLLAVMAADNAFVVDDRGLTHQQLARPLRLAGALGERAWKEAAAKGHTFALGGRQFRVKVVQYKGHQESPFADDTRTNTDVTLENLTNQKTLKYSLLVPDMIERYGFYEGKGTPYRVDPRDILAVLDFLQPAKK